MGAGQRHATQASRADVLCLALGGTDVINCLKQAGEFGVRQTMRIAAPVMLLSDIHALGLPLAQGLLHTNSFYWDANERSRAFTQRVLPRMQGSYPGMIHAGCYSGTLHYLRAMADVGVAEGKRSGRAAIARMKAMLADDDAFGKVSVRMAGPSSQRSSSR
jgi:branched-chain amino acid transport system substrate-binding protein